MATRNDISVFPGNDPALTFTCQTTTAGVSTPVNLTGTTVKCYLKVDALTSDTDASTVVYSSAGASPAITIPTPTNGQAIVQFSHVALEAIGVGRAWYRLDVVDASGNTLTYSFGSMEILAG